MEKPTCGYDIVINNDRVMDPETAFDTIRNVGIKDGRIVTITDEAITGKETIASTALVVAPALSTTVSLQHVVMHDEFWAEAGK